MITVAHHGLGRLHADRSGSICCDVLDAWFDPSPLAIEAYSSSGLTMRTSPDVGGSSLIESIAVARQVDPDCMCLGAGSSELMYRVLPTLYGDGPVVILDPTYSEYPHLLKRDGREIRRVRLFPADGFRASLDDLMTACEGASLVILVNPNNPTGHALSRAEVLRIRQTLPKETSLWVDEAYVDYCPAETSVECDATTVEGLYVLKSLSKAYALSGVRAAYLVCSKAKSQEFVSRTPPWIIGTSAQAAASAAVRDVEYYVQRWAENAVLVDEFAANLRSLRLRVFPGHINALLVECPFGLTSAEWAESLSEAGLLVRTPEGMGEVLRDRFIRIGLTERSVLPRVSEIVASTIDKPI